MSPEPARKLSPAEPDDLAAPDAAAAPPPSLEGMTIELHRLIREGQGDAEAADALRERMYEAWEQSSKEVRALMDSLSGDLYMLQGEEVFEEESSAVPPVVRLKRAWEAKNWRESLGLLRHRSVRDALPEAVRAYFRGQCWSGLGYPAAAFCFLDHAARLAPDNDNYAYLALAALIDLGRVNEALGRANAILRSDASSARLLFKAADVLFHAARRLDEKTAAIVYKRVLLVLDRAIEKEQQLPAAQRIRSITVGGYVHMGFCHEHLGQRELARAAYTSALSVDPGSDAALTARGLLLYDTDRALALRDFERAVATKTPLVWPYLYLAYDALLSGELTRCLEIAQQGLEKTRDPKLLANLLEWIAIVCVRQGWAVDAPVELLREAQAMNPFNERIAANLQRLLAGGSTADALTVANDTMPREASKQLSDELKPAA